MSARQWFIAYLAAWAFTYIADADVIAFGGVITQSIQDGTGPAVNNTGLNSILDGDVYTVTLDFAGPIIAPGTYQSTGANMVFRDLTASVSETSFDSTSITVASDGSFDNISVLGCLTTGSSCVAGNQLDANFSIAAADLNSQNVVATGMGLAPLDLLEDDGVTDIHGSVTSYSETAVPEPSSLALSAWVLAAVASGLFGRLRAYLLEPNSKSGGQAI
jgi:hypothetical protein